MRIDVNRYDLRLIAIDHGVSSIAYTLILPMMHHISFGASRLYTGDSAGDWTSALSATNDSVYHKRQRYGLTKLRLASLNLEVTNFNRLLHTFGGSGKFP